MPIVVILGESGGGINGIRGRARDEDGRIKYDGLRGRREKDGRRKESLLEHSVEMGTKMSYLLVARNCEEGGDRIQPMNYQWSSRRGGRRTWHGC